MTDRLLTKRTLLSLAGTVAVTGLMMSVSDPVMAAGEARAASHPASVSVSVSVAATADPANGDVHINSVSAGAKVSLVTARHQRDIELPTQ